MHALQITQKLRTHVVGVLCMAVGATLSGCSSDTASSKLVKLTGRAQAGPVSGGHVRAYLLQADGTRGAALGTNTSFSDVHTDASGSFTAKVSRVNHPFLLVVTSGSYSEEASGTTVSLGSDEMSALVTGLDSDREVSITPLTHLVAKNVSAALASDPTQSPSTLNASVTQTVVSFFGIAGVTDITKIIPADPSRSLAAQGLADSSAQAQYGLAIAAISQLADSSGKNSLAMLQQLATDFNANGNLNSYSGSYQTAVGTTQTNSTVFHDVTPAASNHAPVASAQSLSVSDDSALPITLAATDADSDALTYAVVASPSHGTLSGSAPNLVYTPSSPYSGGDSFTFKANDGAVDSAVATVSITISHAGGGGTTNHAPSATAQSLSVNDNAVLSLTLAGTDADSDALTYSIVASPSHGTLSGTAPSLLYTPTTPYSGVDSFTFKANDGTADSTAATVSITVSHVNHAPAAPSAVTCPTSPAALSTLNACTLTAASPSDSDGDTVTYVDASSTCSAVSVNSSTGAATFTAPAKGSTCVVAIKAFDGTAHSSSTSSAVITAVNNVPVATAQSPSVPYNAATAITLAGTDADGDTLTYSVVTSPSHGTLSGSAPSLTYTPASAYSGADSFTFRVNDGTANSTAATVSVTVQPPPSIYFYNNGSQPNRHWTTVQNWWSDAAHTVAAGRVPANGDIVHIVSGTNLFDTSAPSLTLMGFIGDAGTAGTSSLTIDAGGTLTVTGGVWSGTVNATATSTFSGTSWSSGQIYGDAVFNDSAYSSSLVQGSATFNYASAQTITLSGSMYWGNYQGAVLDHSGQPLLHWVFSGSSGNGYPITGDATFSGSSYNGGTITGDVTFSGSSYNGGAVNGNATFEDSSYNAGPVTGNATFTAASSATLTLSGSMTWGGTVSGSILDQSGNPILHWIFNNGSSNQSTLPGDAVFNNTSSNSGTVAGDATFNDTTTNNGTVSGDATFHDNAVNNGGGTVSGDASFDGNSYNAASGNISGDAIFRGTSTNSGNVQGAGDFGDYAYNGGTVTGTLTYQSATLYHGSSYSNWNDIGTWYFDSGSAHPAKRDPQDGDSVIYGNGTVFSDNIPTLTLVSYNGPAGYGASQTSGLTIASGGSLTVTTGVWGGTSPAGVTAHFTNDASNWGTVHGNAVFGDTSFNASTIDGNATFNGTSFNYNGYGTVGGTTAYGSGNTIAATNTPLFYYSANNGTGLVDANWSTTANWWTNAGHTRRAQRVPATGDSVTVTTDTTEYWADRPTVTLLLFSGRTLIDGTDTTGGITIDTGGTLDLAGGFWYGATPATASVTLAPGTSGTCVLGQGAVISGDAAFTDCTIEGEVDGTATLNGNSYLSGTGLVAIGILNDNSTITSGRAGAVTFNGNSENLGTVTGNAVFNGNSANNDAFGRSSPGAFGQVLGNATFNDASSNGGGVSGTITCNTSGTCP